MNGIFRYKPKQPVVWFHNEIEKSNQWCLYCGSYIGITANFYTNKEHLIGREFVPKGLLVGTAFNFIFRACQICNDNKSNLERHVSSITLINSPERNSNNEINNLAINKASKDFHPNHKGQLVIKSVFKQNIQLNESVNLGFEFPPQLNSEYAKILALRHIQGMFSLVTTKNALELKDMRLLNPEYFYFLDTFNNNDWGNPQINCLIEKTKDWACHCNIVTAQGFFKVIMKRGKNIKDGWFWALEWNKQLRVIGGISLIGKQQEIFNALPPLKWVSLGIQKGANTRMREEIPLNGADELFVAQITLGKNLFIK